MELTRKQLEAALKSLPVYGDFHGQKYRIPIVDINRAIRIPLTNFPGNDEDSYLVFHWDHNEQDWTINLD